MLTKRFLRFFKVAERATVVRCYFAGNNNVRSNLRGKQKSVSGNTTISSRNIIVGITKESEWKNDLFKQGARSCHTDSDDEPSEKSTSENSLAYEFLRNSKLNLKTIGISLKATIDLTDDEVAEILSKDWQNFSADEILNDFEKLSHRANLRGERLDEIKHGKFLDTLCEKLTELDDEKLRRLFQCFCLWGKTFAKEYPSFEIMWRKLDDECLRRLKDWSIEEALLMCDYWYRFKLCRQAKFTQIAMKKCGKKPQKLNPQNFLHFMFIINTCRKPPINMYEVEYRFDRIFDEFTVNELGIVAMGFFKTQTPIRDGKLITKFHLKILEDVDAVSDVSISAIMKMTRYSTGLHDIQIFVNLLDKLKPRIPKLSIPCISNIVHAAAYIQYHNPDLMKAVIERFEKNIDETRIKDIERLTWSLNIYNYDSQAPIYQTIVKSMRDPKRSTELIKYSKVLPTTLCHLSYVGIYPMDMIKHCFDRNFLLRVYDNNAFKIGYDYFVLENNLQLDRPEYDGPFLSPHIRDFLSTKFIASKFLSNDKVRPADRFTLEVAHICKTVLNSESSIAVDQVLPHYVKQDIIICFDEENNPIDPQPLLSKLPHGTIKYPPSADKNLRWIAVVLATQNQIITDTDRYVGALSCKVRQLEKIGYTPLVVSVDKWRRLSILEAKERYMRQILCSSNNRDALAAGL